jgi:5-formyltetrahydrofolate cyclo-ligase
VTNDTLDDLVERKARLRRQAYDARNAQEAKDEVSRTIVDRFLALPEYAAARTAMWYLDVRSEVRTRHQIGGAVAGGKTIVVPYCTVDERGANKLGLWRLESMDELVVGKWKILEPPHERWGEPGKEVDPLALDLVMVPGVGFTREGARMGNGQGYYDRLLERVRPDAPLIALAYECQIFLDLPVSPHDVYMDKVVTETAAYAGRGRRRSPRGGTPAGRR